MGVYTSWVCIPQVPLLRPARAVHALAQRFPAREVKPIIFTIRSP